MFESCYELREAFDVIYRRPDKLTLVTGEMYPAARAITEKKIKKGGKPATLEGEAVMEGVEHLGQYVYDMTNAKVEQMKREKGIPAEAPLPAIEEGAEGVAAQEVEEEEGVELAGFEAEE